MIFKIALQSSGRIMLRTNLHLQQRPGCRTEKSNSVAFWHRRVHVMAWSRITSGKILFCRRPSGLNHAYASRHWTWLSHQLPVSFMLSFFVHQITEATISHSPPILKKNKIPLRSLQMLFSTHVQLQLFSPLHYSFCANPGQLWK